MKNSKIEWTDHTFNPWWGCVQVSPACAHCYAATFAKRVGLDIWGPDKPRRFFGDKHWAEPLKWNEQAAKAGTRPRVFCASMADVFEDYPGPHYQDLLKARLGAREDIILGGDKELNRARARLFKLIFDTPNLDWLLLTKRPENFLRVLDAAEAYYFDEHPVMFEKLCAWRTGELIPKNVWIGTTVENQEQADKRIPALLRIPARVRFLSCEPLLGELNVRCVRLGQVCYDPLIGKEFPGPFRRDRIHWVICGGESGAGARPMHPDWARYLRDQCHSAEVPFFFKQWGDWKPTCAQYPQTEQEKDEAELAGNCGDIALKLNGTIAEGYQPISPRTWLMDRAGKKAAGRSLDGREWNEVPA